MAAIVFLSIAARLIADWMSAFENNFVNHLDLQDTYMESCDDAVGPVAMTHMSTSKKSYSRLDRMYNSTSLHSHAWVHHVSNRATDVQPSIGNT